MKKRIAATGIFALVSFSSLSFAGGKGGTEVGFASYDDIGIIVSRGLVLDVEFLRSNGFRTYGEAELAAGTAADTFLLGAELSGGLLFGLGSGLSMYGGLGPAIGSGYDTEFGLGLEIGINIDVNRTSVFLEAGSHPATSYFAAGMRF